MPKVTRTLIFDGTYYLERAWALSVSTRSLENLEKNTLNTFLNLLLKDIIDMKVDGALVAFDAKTSWRAKLVPGYKTRRVSEPQVVETLEGKKKVTPTAADLTKKAQKVCELAGIYALIVPDYEAIDLVASVFKVVPGVRIIAAKRKDFLKLVRHHVSVWWPVERTMLNKPDVTRKLKLTPEQLIDALTLGGDDELQIPGIMPPDTAMTLLQKYHSLKKMRLNEALNAKLAAKDKKLKVAMKMNSYEIYNGLKQEEFAFKEPNAELSKLIGPVPPSLKKLTNYE
jgi:5'-3' exonuclease